MAPVVAHLAHLRLQGCNIFPYIDNWLIIAGASKQLSEHCSLVLDLCCRFGLLVKTKERHQHWQSTIPRSGTPLANSLENWGRELSFSQEVNEVLLNSCKSTTKKAYCYKWKHFTHWYGGRELCLHL